MIKNIDKGLSKLSKFSLLTLFSVYFLILVGGIVRSTGSGMGCPDWPKCFGSWVPPTEISQLPENYKEVYSSKREVKNQKLATYLNALGFESLAYQIQHDKTILKESEFNSTKTWIEYVNRLIGVLIGFFIVITFYLSIKFFRSDFKLFAISLTSLILVIIQGWIGSLVVSTNLIPIMVTVHMLIALLIVALLSWIVIRTNPNLNVSIEKNKKHSIMLLLVVCILGVVMQIVFGTQVREAIDTISASLDFTKRNEWISNLGMEFIIHRSFSWVVLILHIVLLYKLLRINFKSMILNSLVIVVISTILTGTIMAYFGMPAFLQPVHLLLGTLGFGLQIFLFLQINSKRYHSI
jgi:cytochrome c oxidase assembly protein subunit 15